jgi:hypothetical protein
MQKKTGTETAGNYKPSGKRHVDRPKKKWATQIKRLVRC